MKTTVLIFCFLCVNVALQAQVKLSFQSELEHSNVSEDAYFKTVLAGAYEFDKYEIETAVESDVISADQKWLSGWKLNIAREFEYKKKQFTVKPFFIYLPVSDLLNETNFGLWLATDFKKFRLNIGTGFRTMAYTRKAVRDFGLNRNTTLHENFILLYDLRYNALKQDAQWKLEVGVTNADHFQIHQSTNPILAVSGAYALNEKLELFSEFRYITAGMMNLHVNYFGALWRVGIVWEL